MIARHSIARPLVNTQRLSILAAALLGLCAALLPPDSVLPLGILVIFILTALITPWSAVIILIVLAPLKTLIATESTFQLPLDIGQLTFIGLLFMWGVDRVVRKYNARSGLRLQWSPIYIPVILFIFVGGLTVFPAQSITAWLTEWLKWLVILVIVILATHLGARDQWRWLVAGLVVAGLANAVVGLYEFFGGSGALHLLINDRFFRAFGTFGQPNPFGGFMGLLLPLALMMALGYAFRTWRIWRAIHTLRSANLAWSIFYGMAALILLAGLVASWSRGAWMGFVVAAGVMAFSFPRKLWQSLLLVSGGIGLIAIMWFGHLLPASIVERVNSATAEYFTFSDVRGVDITPENYAVVERLAHWQAALNMSTARTWLGVGLGNYEVVYPEYRLINWKEALGHAHNYYLNILAEAGIIGLLGYGKAWLMIMWLSWRTRKHPDVLARLVAVGLLGSWTYLSVHHLFDSLYVNNLFVHLGLMLGILSILYNQSHWHVRVKVP
ncbi:MAG: O-antigen ligase family protein [Anaerolineaceae bacterium]|nr:O-antigen ligase family protein [Anaerolineaceae bacterium]